MGTEKHSDPNPEQSYPDSTKHIGEAIRDYLQDDLAPLVTGDEEAVRKNAVEAAKRKLETQRADLDSEIAGIEGEAVDQILHYEEVGDPGTAAAIDKLKHDHLNALVDKGNLPPEPPERKQ